MKYRREIDGLRAVAVLPVMLFHAEIGPFSGGYVGVDIFFVISGFLITGIIYREITQNSFTLSGFYERRARRILPALYTLVFISIVPAWFLSIPSSFVDFSENIIGVVSFSSNIILWLQSGYFDQNAELKPLLHTWSLAVEEQYYLFFPLMLLLVYHYAKNYILSCLFALLLLSLLLSQWGTYAKPTSTYYLLPTRAWELLIGSVIALLETKASNYPTLILWQQKRSNFLSLLGLIMVSISMVWFDERTPFPGFWAVLPTGGAALLILFSKQNTFSYKILSNRFLVGLGLISYSAYLWHQPIYAFARQQTTWSISVELMSYAFLSSLILAYLSWKYVEQPFRNKSRVSVQKIWLLSVTGGAILVLFGVTGMKHNGFPDRFSLRFPLTEQVFDLPKRSNGWCFYSIDTNPSLTLGEDGFNCLLGDDQKPPRILLFGDSYAGMYEPFWDVVAGQMAIGVNSVTTNWCFPSFSNSFWWPSPTPALDQCLLNRKFVVDSLEEYEIVVVSAIWTILEERGLLNEVYEFVTKLTDDHNLKVIIMAQPPSLTRASVTGSVYKNSRLMYDTNEVSAVELNERFSQMATSNNNLFFIDRTSLFSNGESNQQLLSVDGVPYSWDGGHISIYGSLQAGYNFSQKDVFDQLQGFIESD